jgi:hypothetical protein
MATLNIEIDEADQGHFWLMMELFSQDARFWMEATHSTAAERELGRMRRQAALRFMKAARMAKRKRATLQILEDREIGPKSPRVLDASVATSKDDVKNTIGHAGKFVFVIDERRYYEWSEESRKWEIAADEFQPFVKADREVLECPHGCGPLDFVDGENLHCPKCGDEWNYLVLKGIS